jgi:hypothetical protein
MSEGDFDDFDRELRDAWNRAPVDTDGLRVAIRSRIARRRRVGRGIAAVLAAVLIVAAGYRLTRTPQILVDAARDHRVEVVDKAPRRWRGADGAAPVLAGYSLVRAKFCRLDGQRVLHLVYTDGTTEYSLYLTPPGAPTSVAEIRQGGEVVEGLVRGVAVADAPVEGCRKFARAATAAL